MLKIMIFIDGTWLYANTPKLSEAYGDPNFRVDFGKLPAVLAQEIAAKAGLAELDVVRTYLFGSYAANYDLRDEDAVMRRREFFDMLKEEYRYEVETFPINFMGRRIRRADRAPGDSFEPKEKCVDISLASAMLYLAAIPSAYDIGLAVIGDRDFAPMLQCVRRLGKRVALASVKGSCAPEFADPRDEARLKDFDLLWLDDLLPQLEFKYERVQRTCESPMHKGSRLVWTTYRPRKGQKFFCDDCRREFRQQQDEALRQFVTGQPELNGHSPDNGAVLGLSVVVAETIAEVSAPPLDLQLNGIVKKLFADKAYGFISAMNGNEYFFHLTDLIGLDFQQLREGLEIDFEVKKEPGNGKAGAAQHVRPRA